jgi:hypothetical protein
MRYNVRKIIAGIVGGAVLCTTFLALSAPLAPLEPSSGETMSLGQWQAERASQLEEDQDGWDCRVMGNTQCGDTWYELVCPDAPQVSTLLCALEPHKL